MRTRARGGIPARDRAVLQEFTRDAGEILQRFFSRSESRFSLLALVWDHGFGREDRIARAGAFRGNAKRNMIAPRQWALDRGCELDRSSPGA